VPSYLLDNNTINYWQNSKLPKHAAVISVIRSLPTTTFLFTSVIVLGEAEDGMRRITNKSQEQQKKQDDLREFFKTNFPMPVPITADTIEWYGEIRSRVFRHCYPNGKGPKRPEKWECPATASELGIEENDLWIASQAAEKKLILVTHDKMARIRAVVSDLIQIEDWTKSH
jgi:predicted nucleic acid-binding protein